jgi:hypothetical protein
MSDEVQLELDINTVMAAYDNEMAQINRQKVMLAAQLIQVQAERDSLMEQIAKEHTESQD